MAGIAARPNRTGLHPLRPAVSILCFGGLWPALMVSRILSTAVYNPLHACGDRLTDLQHEFSSFDVVGLPGTQLREVNAEQYLSLIHI
eukprot:8816635-Pyramimonas_sp.AAC.1